MLFVRSGTPLGPALLFLNPCSCSAIKHPQLLPKSRGRQAVWECHILNVSASQVWLGSEGRRDSCQPQLSRAGGGFAEPGDGDQGLQRVTIPSGRVGSQAISETCLPLAVEGRAGCCPPFSSKMAPGCGLGRVSSSASGARTQWRCPSNPTALLPPRSLASFNTDSPALLLGW